MPCLYFATRHAVGISIDTAPTILRRKVPLSMSYTVFTAASTLEARALRS
jgi:hypothetical protein